MKTNYWATVAVAIYAIAVVLSMLWVSIEYETRNIDEAELFVEFVEPPVQEPETPPKKVVSPPHNRVAPVEQTEQVAGTEQKSRTVNPKALFKMNKGGSDTPESVGNPNATTAEKEESSGKVRGLNPLGLDALDEGLQGRGLVGTLPSPIYPAGNRGGRVKVRVTVDKQGRVTAATFEPKGSTTSDAVLVEAAIKAAKLARFTESAAFVQGGTITYNFKLKSE